MGVSKNGYRVDNESYVYSLCYYKYLMLRDRYRATITPEFG